MTTRILVLKCRDYKRGHAFVRRAVDDGQPFSFVTAYRGFGAWDLCIGRGLYRHEENWFEQTATHDPDIATGRRNVARLRAWLTATGDHGGVSARVARFETELGWLEREREAARRTA